MSPQLIEFLTYGALLIGAGFLVIVGLVKELAPAQRRRWMLGVGLGTGVLAFTFKIALVMIFSAFSVPLLDILPKPESRQSGDRSVLASMNRFGANGLLPFPYRWEALPHNAPTPADNPQSTAKIALGEALFFDKRLSYDRTLSCASCHELSASKGGADGLASSIGIYDQQGSRNAPTVINAAFQRVLFWDGRADSLEEQALGPLTNPIEMGMPDLASVEQRIRSLPKYKNWFADAFPLNPVINANNTAKAIAAYERTLITPDTAYDRFVRGDRNALSAKQQRGMALFVETGCPICHSGPNFSEASVFGVTDVYRAFPAIPRSAYETKYNLTDDLGLASNQPNAKRGIWRVPSLRNVSRTAPYFHNGSVDTLEEAVRIMATVQLGKTLSNREADDRLVQWSADGRYYTATRNMALSDEEVGEIVAFLEALAGDPVSEQVEIIATRITNEDFLRSDEQ